MDRRAFRLGTAEGIMEVWLEPQNDFRQAPSYLEARETLCITLDGLS